MGGVVRKITRTVKKKLLPDDVERELDRVVSQADENLKDLEDDVKNLGRDIDEEVLEPIGDFGANLEDVITGKTPDAAAEEMREYEKAQKAAAAEKDTAAEEREIRRATAMEKRISSRRRARRAGRRSLVSSSRLGGGTDGTGKNQLGTSDRSVG